MSYFIVPDKKTRCENNFGRGLSFFFEQVGGYGETAEVEQVSKILDIDLSVFQDLEYDPDDPEEVEQHWHSLDTFTLLIETFIAKIKAQPNYHKQVHHNPNRDRQLDEEQKIWQITDTAERDRQLEKLHSEPFYFYPPDYGYLSEGRLLKDLETLKKTLSCYKKNGVTKIRFEYM